jgi:hypothetical protein
METWPRGTSKQPAIPRAITSSPGCLPHHFCHTLSWHPNDATEILCKVFKGFRLSADVLDLEACIALCERAMLAPGTLLSNTLNQRNTR